MVKVRITQTPRECELDGVRVDQFERGSVREVSASIGSWLIAEHYAELEMRRAPRDETDWSKVNDLLDRVQARRHPARDE